MSELSQVMEALQAFRQESKESKEELKGQIEELGEKNEALAQRINELEQPSGEGSESAEETAREAFQKAQLLEDNGGGIFGNFDRRRSSLGLKKSFAGMQHESFLAAVIADGKAVAMTITTAMTDAVSKAMKSTGTLIHTTTGKQDDHGTEVKLVRTVFTNVCHMPEIVADDGSAWGEFTKAHPDKAKVQSDVMEAALAIKIVSGPGLTAIDAYKERFAHDGRGQFLAWVDAFTASCPELAREQLTAQNVVSGTSLRTRELITTCGLKPRRGSGNCSKRRTQGA